MLYCPHCNKTIDEDLVFCPKCREVLVEEAAEREVFQLQGEVEEAKDRANMYVILAVVLVTMGIIGGGILFMLSSLFGLFGIALVCLGIGCTASAGRRERRARSLKKQLSGCN